MDHMSFKLYARAYFVFLLVTMCMVICCLLIFRFWSTETTKCVVCAVHDCDYVIECVLPGLLSALKSY